jgi:hypothetical protein
MFALRSDYQFYMADVTKCTGVSRDKAEKWMQMGLINPSIQSASGRGNRNIFNLEDLFLIKFIDRIISSGWDRKLAGQMISSIKTSDLRILIESNRKRFPLLNAYSRWKEAINQTKKSGNKSATKKLEKIFRCNIEPDEIAIFSGMESDEFILDIRKRAFNIKVELCFIVFSEEGHREMLVRPIISEYSDKSFKSSLPSIHRLSELSDMMHLFNFGRIMDGVMMKVFYYFNANLIFKLGEEITLYFGEDVLRKLINEKKLPLDEWYGINV